jgi:hypothetical protein
VFKSLREFGYISVACASVLGVLMLFKPVDRTAPAKLPPPPAAKTHR